MTSSTRIRYPKLRNIDIRPIVHEGRTLLLLRDPLQLSEAVLLVPPQLASVLALCDGRREDARHLSIAHALISGLGIEPGTIGELLSALDEALLLENQRFTEALGQALSYYREAEARPPALAGQSYPADPDELRRLLESYIEAAENIDAIPQPPRSNGCGLVSPHIDYARGGPVYAAVWKHAEEMVKAAELVVLLGTNHFGGERPVTLTRQNYATPFGVLPTAREVVDRVAEAIGEEQVFAGELHHRGEHSIELAAVWLHYMRDSRPVEIVPILCGGFGNFVSSDADVESDRENNLLIEVLKRETAGRRTLIVAAGDLSHVGPAFGGAPVEMAGHARLKEADDELIERMCAGDARGFFEAIKRVEDRNNVCGVSPIYLAMRMLGDVQGERVSYDRCPADEHETSFVSVCGVIFR
ncbi:MAG TPA: AmmeMemoRadiSam system protein B [Blastocatellia bacterium]|nr:AmmeMemoRadiSam system protein B [Blastocatellia bacterium]